MKGLHINNIYIVLKHSYMCIAFNILNAMAS